MNNYMDELRHWFGAIGFALAVVAITVALYFNHTQTQATEASLREQVAASCRQQHAASEQWHAVVGVIERNYFAANPDEKELPDALKQFEEDTYKVYDRFPACKEAA